MSTSAARIAANKSGSVSVARLEANRANAQRSTGPRTPEGKARVSENALKHGLRSERNPLDLATDTALPFEREDFESTLVAFMDDLAPQGPIETRLVERLAQIDLRLNRAIRMETTHLDMHIGLLTRSMAGALPSGEGAEQTQHAWLTTLAFLKNPSATTLIAQYESRLNRDFARTLSQLRQAQALRVRAEVEKLSVQTQPATVEMIHAAAEPAEGTQADTRALPSNPVPPLHTDNNFAEQTQADAQPIQHHPLHSISHPL